MGLFTKDIKTLDDLFAHGLKDVYYAEQQIIKSLPQLIDKASNAQLKRALKLHLKETEMQVSRLEQIFAMREEAPKGTKCYGILGLIDEANEVMDNVAEKKILDKAVVASAQAVEHYEISRYRALIAWAGELGRNDFARILEANLSEEEAANAKLSEFAEKRTTRRGAKASQQRTQKGRTPAKRSAATKHRSADRKKSA